MTLTEVVFGFFLLLLVVVIVLQLYPMAMSTIRVSGQRTQACALAEAILTDALQQPLSALPVAPPKALAKVNGRGTVFEPTIEILAVNQPGIETDRMRAIRVRVRWKDGAMQREIVREQWRVDAQL